MLPSLKLAQGRLPIHPISGREIYKRFEFSFLGNQPLATLSTNVFTPLRVATAWLVFAISVLCFLA